MKLTLPMIFYDSLIGNMHDIARALLSLRLQWTKSSPPLGILIANCRTDTESSRKNIDLDQKN